ncbi:MAG: CDP-diacylglycerol--glycerol-3-phosphate 3-phosphatidyltransferase [Isosphaeraceae bacterium]|nr:CDP-diacylglycerol--glycerol-3-phosphate 3-phosphatidyltransferase [Isosphaeraceae bacterium]
MATTPLPRFWNVPNTLTLSRLGLAVVVFGFIAAGWYLAALAVFGVAALTDALDGYFARRLGQATAIGRQLDPLVDKVIVCGGLIYLLTIPGSGLAPWMVTAIVVRELVVQALRSLIEGRGEPFGARWAGKLKTFFQCLAIVAILIGLAMATPPRAWLMLRDVLNWLAVGLTVYSGLGYVALAWPKLRAG